MASTVTSEQFSLRWNNFHSNLKSGFHELLQQADMVDVTLAVDGHFLQAHKVVLSICSPYFKQLFKVNPCKHPIVILKDVCHEDMKDILQFMYMGEVSVLRDNLSSFLRTAEILQVKGLTGDESNEDSRSQKDEKCDIDTEGESDIYNQLIETTTDIDLPTPYSQQFPVQTSPLPLNTSKRQSKTLTPPHTKKPKCSDSYSASSNSVKPAVTNKESEIPKPKSEYKSCDFSNAQNLNSVKSVGENEEAKDYSKACGILWESNTTTNVTGIGTATSTAANNTDAYTTDQGGRSDSRSFRHGYQCEQCLKKFSRRDHLRTHEKNIHGSDAGPFKCVICEQLYKNTESLRKHIAKFHFTNMNDLGQNKIEVKI
ncbi:protein abrupt-like isoform X1 [Sitophilus oryzae]|uniref:Protein abrupt-like isoform X1 n=1 Tax=Sitophilus oryzae TaxID=7048 RepID=A0A6J2YT47_SITOR|nr:protein abrupt-like isoform X1 [Sitophilus oryzae]XP_030765977.1 protein abrupt-like isoform X1 [Sitophilus oryzae]XP_030765980.1 protein abrupt-like isoform X1 [Sitophilus oryzae]